MGREIPGQVFNPFFGGNTMDDKIQIIDGGNDHKYFTVIPNYILNHSTIWDREVYIQIRKVAGDNGTCYFSKTNFAKQCGMSKRRLDRSIDYLLKHKWISFIGKKEISTKGGGQFVNEYKANDIWKMNVDFYTKGGAQNTPPNPKGGAQNDTKGVHENRKGGAGGAPKEEPLNNNPTKEDNTAATAATRLDFQKLVDYFFELKGWANKEKNFYKQERIVYARYIRPAKELMSLCEENLDEAKMCLKKVSDWAQSRDLDWSIETIFKKWYDIDKLKPKEKKSYYKGNRVFEICGRKFVLMPNGEKLEFAGSEKEITFK
jgi:hypothetical protein